ncbi:DUF4183 domain-containing protein [Paenibacillus sanguinis]|uniref:DUF4183 domain-containing protein n=1 Tax=Paenibacillus sanguinis TaxID=225906 RepID=UPI00037BBF41|nr:DUF4183 domain-containing protein [Paenibacillus sanguinis]
MPVIRLYLPAESIITGSVNTTTTTSVVPEVQRYTAVIVLGDIFGGTTTLQATRFTNNLGNTVPAGGLVVPTANGYYNLYVNGVMQRGGLSTLTPSSLVINSGLVIGATVVVNVVNFNSTSGSVSDLSNLSVTTNITY